MLEINQDLLVIEDQIDEVVAGLLATPQAKHYQSAKRALQEDQVVQREIHRFTQLQADYDEQKAYAKFRPEVAQLKRQLLAQKRKVDMTESVQNFRQAEVALQELLAQMAQRLADAVAADVFVDTGLPFAPHKRKHGHGAGDNIREKES